MAKSAPERRFPVERGEWGYVEYARTANGKYEAQEFLDSAILKEFGGNGRKVRRRLIAIFENISDYGVSPKLEHKREYIYGIKFEFSRKLIRFPCFLDGLCWVLTHGFYKPGAQKGLGPWPKEELDKADRIRSEHRSNLTS